MTNEDYEEIGEMFMRCLRDLDDSEYTENCDTMDVMDFLQVSLESGNLDDLANSWKDFSSYIDSVK